MSFAGFLGISLFGAAGALISLGALSGPASADNVDCSAKPKVSIDSVDYCGRKASRNDAVTVFQGIKYANAPRWMEPTAPTGMQSPVDASNFKAMCPQSGNAETAKGSGVYQSAVVGVEDCLYLNVWTSADMTSGTTPAATRPVMFFIHGGAFIAGSAADGAVTHTMDGDTVKTEYSPDSGMYDGTSFAAQGVVVVTINYRLGALGFLSYQAKDAIPYSWMMPKPIPGNFGIMDQIAALEWVRENVAKFGGNPDTITIFGESAGAMSVGLLNYASQTANGMIDAAIMESNPMGVAYETRTGDYDTDKGTHYHETGELFIEDLCARRIKEVDPDFKIPTTYQEWIDFVTDALPLIGLNCTGDWIRKADGDPPVTIEMIVGAQDVAASSTGSFVDNPKFTNILPWLPVLNSTAPDGIDPKYKLDVNQPRDGYAGTETKQYTAHPIMYGVNRDEGVLFINFIKKAGQFAVDEVYDRVVDHLFKVRTQRSVEGAPQGSDILKIVTFQEEPSLGNPSTSVQPYCPGKNEHSDTSKCTSPGGYLPAAAEDAFSNVATDFIFHCVNSYSGEASAGAPARAFVQPYIFTQIPTIEVFPSLPTAKNPDPKVNPCNASSSTFEGGQFPTCHAYELPFVFDTVGTTLQTKVDIAPGEYEKALELAAAMNTDWANFAKTRGKFDLAPAGGKYLLRPSATSNQQPVIQYGNQDPWANADPGSSHARTFNEGNNCGASAPTDLWYTRAVPQFAN